MKKFFKSTYYISVVVLFLIVAAAGFTQTRTFRSYLRSTILEELRTIVRGTLTLGEIQGNLATGFHIERLGISKDDSVVFFADRLEARYDPVPLLFGRLTFFRITLFNPQINLWKKANGAWNIEELFELPADADTSSSPPAIDLKLVELLNARVTIVDSAAMLEHAGEGLPATAFNYANLSFNPLTLKMALRIDGPRISGNLRNLEVRSERPLFRLSQLSGEFLITPRLTEVRKLSITTANSRLSLDARLEGADLFAISRLEELRDAPVSLKLSVGRLDVAEFQQFLPGPVDFLATSAAFDVQASGTFGRLRVDEVAVKTPRSYVRIQGELSNLHRPWELEIDATARDNIIHPADLLDLLPGLHLPDFRTFGVLSCELRFKGQPDHFRASVRGKLAAGEFHIDSELDLRGNEMIYNGEFTTAGFDVGTLLAREDLQSHLNLRGVISGSGTSMKTMASVVRIQIDSSAFRDLLITNSVLVVNAADRTLRSNFLLTGGPTRMDVNLFSRYFNRDSLTYDLRGRVSSLNLAQVTGDRFTESDLSFDLRLVGTNLEPESMTTELELGFLRSSFTGHWFDESRVSLRYGTQDSIRRLALTSDIADLDISGNFTPVSFVSVLSRGSELLADAIAHRFATLDSLRGRREVRVRQPFVFRGPWESESTAADFVLEVKDFTPLGVFLREPMGGVARIEASVHSSTGALAFKGKAEIPSFSITSGATGVEITDGELDFDLAGLIPRNTMENLRSSLKLSAGRILYDSVGFSDVAFRHDLLRDSSQFSVSCIVDSAMSVDLAGTSSFVPNVIDLSIARLRIAVAELGFENADTIHTQFGKDGIRFGHFTMQHETEELSLEGLLDPGGSSNVQFSVRNFLIANLKEFSRSASYMEMVQDFNGILSLDGSFRGNFAKPAFTVALEAQGVRVGRADFGTIAGRGAYAEGLADIFVEFKSRPDEPNVPSKLFISGKMPLTLGEVSPVREKSHIDLVIKARGFGLEFIDPFISVTSKLTGQVFADMKMRGTLSEPSYEGSLRIEGGQFFFVPLGITYNLQGKLIPKGQEIVLEDMALANVPADRVPALVDGLGSMNLSGSLFLSGLEVKRFDITSSGQLLIMKEGSRLTGLPMYGNVYVATGTLPVQWTGTPQRSFVSGDVLIKNATIIFPPSQDVVFERPALFTVTFIDDTSKAQAESSQTGSVARAPNGTAGTTQASTGRPASTGETSFLDNIMYNLTIETAGLTQVRFVLNPLTNEELFADLKGRLVFSKDAETSRLTGELEVGPRSYYKYFKTLQATGKLLFTGDLTNPELDILATYEGLYTPVDTTQEDQKVVVRLNITGTRQEPKVAMGLEVYDSDGNKLPQRPDVQSDAIAFLVSGTFKDEMTQQQETSLTANLLRSISSSLLTAPLTEFVRSEVGYVTSIDVAYYGGSKSFEEAADIRVTGEVGDAVIRLGGRVFQDVSNTNLSVQFPMSAIVGSDAWRNLVLELERRVEGVESFERRRDSKGIRLLYRITF